MGPVEAPQFYKNTLEPIEINQTNLLNALTELRSATRRGAELVEKGSPAERDGKAGLFMGILGISVVLCPNLTTRECIDSLTSLTYRHCSRFSPT